MRKLAALAALGTLFVVGLQAMPATASAAATCRGQAATIIGAKGATVTGTEGPDVIMARGGIVEALGGDDLICALGYQMTTTVLAGPGDDVVDGRRSGSTSARLGVGRDTYVGGSGFDYVLAGELSPGADPASAVDPDPDVISTGGAADYVVSGAPGEQNRDDVNTGGGIDHVMILDSVAGARLDFGSGLADSIEIWLASTGHHKWRVDTRGRTISRDGVSAEWKGTITSFGFEASPVFGAGVLTFVGSRAAERLSVGAPRLVPRLRLQGGDDKVRVDHGVRRGSYLLGSGHDRLELGWYDRKQDVTFPVDRLRVDLARRTVDVGARGVDGTIDGVESLVAAATRLRVLGSSRAERIRGQGCHVIVAGGLGADTLERESRGVSTCSGAVIGRIHGGGGADKLFGSDDTDDVLFGDAGRDRAEGRGGTDTCRAEVTRGCELT